MVIFEFIEGTTLVAVIRRSVITLPSTYERSTSPKLIIAALNCLPKRGNSSQTQCAGGYAFTSWEDLNDSLERGSVESTDVRLHGTTHERPRDRVAHEEVVSKF
jgi:hypothetical protein